ncbi:DNA polymerase I [Fodinisporobacter ferrooxydans]|uniref:DNA polymerase I n=1 Tax=Fodinisporobacter ferrooxydans TaxID=2901836 RepID=A0ABY4CQ90_9BACL|nr:DNA polymerase I [Alicyclobacillaceae bacterium MYW30-H2]
MNENDTRQKLIIIDGNSIAYRAFFALPLLSNGKGQFTNAVYGFTMMLMKLLEDEKPTHIVVAFDAGKANFRHELYKEYKGTREKTPGELSGQFPLVRDIVTAFGIRHLELSGYEADDIIGTITRFAEEQHIPSLVVSGDKDLLQLVSEHVHTLLTRKGITEVERYTIAKVQERYGLTPEQIIDLKGLMGDTSDNIPGIPGVGEKTALKLLHEFGSVEQVLERADQVSGKKLQEKLREFADQARLSKELATIHRSIPLTVDFADFEYQAFDVKKVRDVFRTLEFKSLLDKLPVPQAASANEAGSENGCGFDGDADPSANSAGQTAGLHVDIRIARDDQEIRQFLQTIQADAAIIADVQIPEYAGNFAGIAVAREHSVLYIPIADFQIPEPLIRLLQDEQKIKISYDVKTLMVRMLQHGQGIDTHWFDVLLSSYLLNPSEGQPDIYEILNRDLGWQLSAPDWFGKKAKQEGPADEDRAQWLGQIACGLYLNRSKLAEALEAQSLQELYQELELPLTFVLGQMEALGVAVDRARLQEIGEHLQERIAQLTKDIYQMAGTEFNINSPKQMGEILFDKLGLPTMKKTKTGYSTSADVLEKLAPYHEIVQKILDFRQLGKLLSTYVEGLLKVVETETGKVHTRFNQALTATGRLSSQDPNLQNIPIRMEEGRKLRQAFIPSESGWLILSADYSQVELRIMAHLSQDASMIEAFQQDMDIHTRTASDVFEVPIEAVTSLMRRTAKAVNFGIIYGISDYGLSQNLNITRAQAGEFIENYFAKFKGVKRFMDEIVAKAREDGYVTTMLNRRRYLPDIHSKNFNLRSFAERTAMNTPIQGTAADIIKKAMVNIDKVLKEQSFHARMLLQVHDELIFECPPEELESLQEVVREQMEHALTLRVPLKVDIHYGPTWYEAK